MGAEVTRTVHTQTHVDTHSGNAQGKDEGSTTVCHTQDDRETERHAYTLDTVTLCYAVHTCVGTDGVFPVLDAKENRPNLPVYVESAPPKHTEHKFEKYGTDEHTSPARTAASRLGRHLWHLGRCGGVHYIFQHGVVRLHHTGCGTVWHRRGRFLDPTSTPHLLPITTL